MTHNTTSCTTQQYATTQYVSAAGEPPHKYFNNTRFYEYRCDDTMIRITTYCRALPSHCRVTSRCERPNTTQYWTYVCVRTIRFMSSIRRHLFNILLASYAIASGEVNSHIAAPLRGHWRGPHYEVPVLRRHNTRPPWAEIRPRVSASGDTPHVRKPQALTLFTTLWYARILIH